ILGQRPFVVAVEDVHDAGIPAMRAGSESRRAALGAYRRFAPSPPSPQVCCAGLTGGSPHIILGQRALVVSVEDVHDAGIPAMRAGSESQRAALGAYRR